MAAAEETCKDTKIPIWLDCDPGHDDAFAILMASHSPEIDLLGISIVHGNDTVENCALNAKRFLWASGVKGIPVYSGIYRPFIREPKYCPEIHGLPGKDGVAGMCGYHFPDHEIFSDPSNLPDKGHGVIKMVESIASHPRKVTVVATGSHTNLAMALRMFPTFKKNVEKIVFMGGALGFGNTGLASEFNIEIDPESAHVVFHSGIPLVMIPLEVTHTVLVTPHVLKTIEQIDKYQSTQDVTHFGAGLPAATTFNQRHIEYSEVCRTMENVSLDSNLKLPKISEEITLGKSMSKFSDCCVQLLSFFKSTYQTVFSFESPPFHDPCAIFYVLQPDAFKSAELFLDVEISGEKCAGRTLVDVHGLTKNKPNAIVCYRLDVQLFWERMFKCLQIADRLSPMNNSNSC